MTWFRDIMETLGLAVVGGCIGYGMFRLTRLF